MAATVRPEPTPTATHRVDERRGRAMGAALHAIVVTEPDRSCDPDAILLACRREIDRLEALWSRFETTSEVSALNRSIGPQLVSPETRELVARSVEAWHRTGGRFDPTIHDDLVASGYDRDIELLQRDEHTTGIDPASGPAPEPPTVRPSRVRSSACGAIVVDHADGTVTLPPSVSFDGGGIGKGLAADRVSALAVRLGASGVLINLGGDLRCRGLAPTPGGWSIEARWGPTGSASTMAIADGGVATSTCRRRHWSAGGIRAHHLIDPTTGRSRPDAAEQVTVVAATAAEAETIATAIAATDLADAPTDPELAALVGAAGALVVDHRGATHLVGSIADFLR